MINLNNYQDFISDIISEIKVQLENWRKLQIPKWNIIIDPGVGFAKNGY